MKFLSKIKSAVTGKSKHESQGLLGDSGFDNELRDPARQWALDPNLEQIQVEEGMRRLNMANQNFKGADFRNGEFANVDLSRSILRYADCSNADFTGAVLYKTDFRGANLTGVDLSKAADTRGIKISRDTITSGTTMPR